jgi:hypothetical protein
MILNLNHAITRKLNRTAYLYKGRLKGVKITLTPYETLLFSIAGTRHKIEIDLSHCLNLAEIQNINTKFQTDLQAYKEGRRRRRPKRVFYPYSDVYLKSIETLKQL